MPSKIALLSLVVLVNSIAAAETPQFPQPNQLPSVIGAEKFELLLGPFLTGGKYKDWKHDNGVRATGPFLVGLNGTAQSFGTHGASGVKVFYSPGAWNWLLNGRKG